MDCRNSTSFVGEKSRPPFWKSAAQNFCRSPTTNELKPTSCFSASGASSIVAPPVAGWAGDCSTGLSTPYPPPPPSSRIRTVTTTPARPPPTGSAARPPGIARRSSTPPEPPRVQRMDADYPGAARFSACACRARAGCSRGGRSEAGSCRDSGIQRNPRYGGEQAYAGTGGRTCPPHGYQAEAPEIAPAGRGVSRTTGTQKAGWLRWLGRAGIGGLLEEAAGLAGGPDAIGGDGAGGGVLQAGGVHAA